MPVVALTEGTSANRADQKARLLTRASVDFNARPWAKP
jgi:hypothetical protein